MINTVDLYLRLASKIMIYLIKEVHAAFKLKIFNFGFELNYDLLDYFLIIF